MVLERTRKTIEQRQLAGPENPVLLMVSGGPDSTAPISGYTNNIQGNLALSANKHGLCVEPMDAYRARRKNI